MADTVIIAKLVVGDFGPGGSKPKSGKGCSKPNSEPELNPLRVPPRIHPVVLVSPLVESDIAHTVLAAQIGNMCAGLRLSENGNDLAICVS